MTCVICNRMVRIFAMVFSALYRRKKIRILCKTVWSIKPRSAIFYYLKNYKGIFDMKNELHFFVFLKAFLWVAAPGRALALAKVCEVNRFIAKIFLKECSKQLNED